MVSQLLIAAVHDRIFTLFMADDAGFQIIAYKQLRRAAKVLIHMHMGIYPVLLLHGYAGLRIAVHAERKCRYKQIAFAGVIRHPVIDFHCCAGPVHHALSPGLCWICIVSRFWST